MSLVISFVLLLILMRYESVYVEHVAIQYSNLKKKVLKSLIT